MIEKVTVSQDVFLARQQRAIKWQRRMKQAFQKKEAERKVAFLVEIRRAEADRIAEEFAIAAMYRQRNVKGRKARREFREKMRKEM